MRYRGLCNHARKGCLTMHQAYLNAPICYLLAYAVEGFAEVPGTLWVGAPSLPKILSFLTRRDVPRRVRKRRVSGGLAALQTSRLGDAA